MRRDRGGGSFDVKKVEEFEQCWRMCSVDGCQALRQSLGAGLTLDDSATFWLRGSIEEANPPPPPPTKLQYALSLHDSFYGSGYLLSSKGPSMALDIIPSLF